MLKEKIGGDIDLVNLKLNPKPDLNAYATVIIGGSIHAGSVQSAVKNFCQEHMSMLLQKQLGLYLCCMEEGDKAQKQFEEAYPKELRQQALASGCLGGEFDFKRMNFMEKFVIKNFIKVKESVSKINHQTIDEFAEKMKIK
jgi:menaquinone-dependent protoporphyrinogen oxidase